MKLIKKYAVSCGCTLFALLLLISLVSCATGKTDQKADTQPDSPKDSVKVEFLDKPVPADGFTLRSMDGGMVSLEDYRGKVVWVSFWATWCHSCKAEMAEMNKVRQRLKEKGFEVLAVNVDTADLQNYAMGIARSLKVSFPVLFDSDSRVVASYNPSMELPYSVLVDRQGRKRFIQRGYLPGDEKRIENAILEILGE